MQQSIVVVLGLLFDILEEFMHKKGLSNKSGPWVGLVCSGFRVQGCVEDLEFGASSIARGLFL